MLNIEKLIDGILDAVDVPLKAFADRLKAVEDRASVPGPKGEDGAPGVDGGPGVDGKDADPTEIAALLVPEVTKAVQQLPPAEKGEAGDIGPEGPAGPIGPAGADGKDVDPESVREIIAEEVSKAVVELPPAEKGEAGEKGDPGKDADPEAVREIVGEEVVKAIEGLPPAERGEKGEVGDPGEKGDAGADGANGIGLADAVLARDGNLVLTMTDGRVKDLGNVNGMDGKDGAPGRDGFGFDDMTMEYDGERSFTFRFERGEHSKEFTFKVAIVIDRGVFKEGNNYEKGDSVTWGGSVWIAQEETIEKPGDSKSWRLAVKRGRDGKIGKDGERGPQGPKGGTTKDG